MNSTDCIKDFARLARALAKYSPCKRRGVACVVLDSETLQCVGWGVNGPAGMEPGNCTGIKDGCGCAHSEVNTLLNCRPCGLHGHIMIVSRAPCVPCATAMVNCGFVDTVYYLDDSEPGAQGLKILANCGLVVEHLDVPEGAEIGLRDPNMEPSKPRSYVNKELAAKPADEDPACRNCGHPESRHEVRNGCVSCCGVAGCKCDFFYT